MSTKPNGGEAFQGARGLRQGIGLKQVLAILVLASASVGALGQGKVSFQNDSASRIELGGFRIFPPDQNLAGQPIPTTGPLPSGITMMAGLYAGTSSSSLVLVSSVALNPVGGTGQPAGIIPPTQVTLPFPGGTLTYMQVRVWDAAFSDLDAELAGCPTYFAWTPVFTMTPGTFSYPSIISGGGTTWQETPIVIGYWNLDPTWPVIHEQPQSQTVSLVSSASFHVGAFADGRMMYYQWYKDGVPITNATSATYTIASASLTDAGLYSVWVYSPCGSCLSDAARLTVAMKPAVTQSPLDQTAGFGASAEFTVSAVGSPPLSYQWCFDGRPIWGASNSTLELTYVQPSQAGIYSVTVTNAFGAVTSSPATLIVAGRPQLNRPTGTVVAWGYDYFGESTVPANLSVAVAVAAGTGHSLVLQPDGTMVGWGDNRRSQSAIPAGLRSVIAIDAGGAHSLALTANGTVVAWGDNSLGQVNVPVNLGEVIAIAAGGYHNLALKSDRTVIAWGYNAYGQSSPPVGLTNVAAIAAGTDHSLALKSDGTVVAWGYNFQGQCAVPAGLHSVVAIAAGGLHSLALKADGTIVGWGYNYYGQTTPPPGLTNVIAIAGGGVSVGQGGHNLALKPDGTVVAWGDDSLGQTNVPASLAGVIAIAAGGYHSLALTTKPILLTPPAGQTAELGSTVAFDAYAMGHTPLIYQWLFNSTNIIRAASSNSQLRLTEVQISSTGLYSVFVSNAVGAVTSPPAMLQVIAPVERRPVPGIILFGDAGSLLNLDYTDLLNPTPLWTPLDSVSLTSTSQYYFDLSSPLPSQRFYRSSQPTGASPALDLHMIPAITLTGIVGDQIRVDAINRYGPTDAWFPLDTVTLTNTSQLYFDISVVGQPTRLYRLAPVP